MYTSIEWYVNSKALFFVVNASINMYKPMMYKSMFMIILANYQALCFYFESLYNIN